MSYYVEIELDVYDSGPVTTGVGHYLNLEKAQTAAANIELRLRRGSAKTALDERYGEQGYGLTVIALRLRTPSEAIDELIDGAWDNTDTKPEGESE